MNTGKVIAITLSVILIVFLVGAYGFLASRGLSARKKPSNFEYSIANTALGVIDSVGGEETEEPA